MPISNISGPDLLAAVLFDADLLLARGISASLERDADLPRAYGSAFFCAVSSSFFSSSPAPSVGVLSAGERDREGGALLGERAFFDGALGGGGVGCRGARGGGTIGSDMGSSAIG